MNAADLKVFGDAASGALFIKGRTEVHLSQREVSDVIQAAIIAYESVGQLRYNGQPTALARRMILADVAANPRCATCGFLRGARVHDINYQKRHDFVAPIGANR